MPRGKGVAQQFTICDDYIQHSRYPPCGRMLFRRFPRIGTTTRTFRTEKTRR